MHCDVILAGVGGQGVIATAAAICGAAARQGLEFKQVEVHGMSRRGGAVESHVRLADHPIRSGLVSKGQADLIIALEPMEALRYREFLRPGGALVAAEAPVRNIPDYPEIGRVHSEIRALPRHVILDAARLARAAGNARAENMALLGAASRFLPLRVAGIEAIIRDMFAAKGERAVERNLRALAYGRAAGALGEEMARRGLPAARAAALIGRIRPDSLAAAVERAEEWSERLRDPAFAAEGEELDGATPSFAPMIDFGRIDAIFAAALREGRTQLHEHEVYAVLGAAGVGGAPDAVLVRNAQPPDLSRFPGDRIVLKAVSPTLVHKAEAGGVAFVEKTPEAVAAGLAAMRERVSARGHALEGILVVEAVADRARFGDELLFGMRASDAFDMIVSVGPGGADAEALAQALRPGRGNAIASIAMARPEDLLDRLETTLAGKKLSGRMRDWDNPVGRNEVLAVLRAFFALGRRYGPEGDGPCRIVELEVNPMAAVGGRLRPLDGVCRLAAGRPARPAPPPVSKIENLLYPRSAAVMGVSSKGVNAGRVILRNFLAAGFPAADLRAIKPGEAEIDGVACVPSLAALDRKVDLAVVSVDAAQVAETIREIADRDAAGAVVLIPGGLGEKKGGEALAAAARAELDRARSLPGGGPLLVGPNCLGLRSVPGRYDTLFIPGPKLPPSAVPGVATHLALVSQSGAYMITRLSRFHHASPRYAISTGNQMDLTATDILSWLADHDPEVEVFSLYIEGFKPGEGLAFARAVRRIGDSDRLVIFYKAGRTPAGRSATASHTASIAGDLEVCEAVIGEAGAVIASDFEEFDALTRLACIASDKRLRGLRAALVSNAGYETVGMADAIGPGTVALAPFSAALAARIERILASARLERLVNVANPLDLTPMAPDRVYEDVMRAILEDPGIDLVFCGMVPLTPNLKTLPAGTFGAEDLAAEDGVAARLGRLHRGFEKPLVVIVDGGRTYDAFADAVERHGLPVLRSADRAVRATGKLGRKVLENRRRPTSVRYSGAAPARG